MDHLLTNRTSAWFLWVFGKEQASVTASRGVSLMPQLKTAKPAGPWSTVPYFTCFKVALIIWPIFTRLLLKGPSFGAISLIGLNLPHSVLFPPKVNQHNEPRSKLFKSHWQDLYVPFKWNDTTCVLSLCHWSHRPLLYFLLIHNGPPPMSTLVPAWRRRRYWSSAGSLRGACPASALPAIGTVKHKYPL